MRSFLIALVILLASICGVSAQTVVCAPILGFSSMSRQIVNPETTHTFILDSRGCTVVTDQADIGFLATHGIVPPLGGTATAVGGGTSGLASIDTIASIKNIDTTGLVANTAVQVLGYYVAGDGGGGLYRWAPGNTSTPDDGIVLVPNSGGGVWIRDVPEALVPLQVWGAIVKPSGITVDTQSTTQIQNAFNYASANNASLYCNGVFYSDTLTLTGTVHMIGPNNQLSNAPNSGGGGNGSACEIRKGINGTTLTGTTGGTLPSMTYWIRVYGLDGSGNLLDPGIKGNVVQAGGGGVCIGSLCNPANGNNALTVTWPVNASAAGGYRLYFAEPFIVNSRFGSISNFFKFTNVTSPSCDATTCTQTLTTLPSNPGLLDSVRTFTYASGAVAGSGTQTFTGVNLTSTGGGTGALATVTTDNDGFLNSIVVTTPGSGYHWFDDITINPAEIGGATGFTGKVYTLQYAPDYLDPLILIPYNTNYMLILDDVRLNGGGRASHDIFFCDSATDVALAVTYFRGYQGCATSTAGGYIESYTIRHSYIAGATISGMYVGVQRFLGWSDSTKYFGGRHAVRYNANADHRSSNDTFSSSRGQQGDECNVVHSNSGTSAYFGSEIFDAWCGIYQNQQVNRNKWIGTDIDTLIFYGIRTLGQNMIITENKFSGNCRQTTVLTYQPCADIMIGGPKTDSVVAANPNVQSATIIGNVHVVGGDVGAPNLPDYSVYFGSSTRKNNTCPSSLLAYNHWNSSGAGFNTDVTNDWGCVSIGRSRQTININNVSPKYGTSTDSLWIIGHDGDDNHLRLDNYKAGVSGQTHAPYVDLYSHNGTALAPTHSNIINDLGIIRFGGDTDVGIATGGEIKCTTTEQFSATNNGTKCAGRGTANASATVKTAIQWQNGVWIGVPSVDPTLTQGELGLAKITDPAAGPGAGVCKFVVKQGTAGTCTLSLYCGTSATPFDIATNVGTGC